MNYLDISCLIFQINFESDGMRGEEFGGLLAEEEEEPLPVALRTNFNPLANFTPSALTDAEGKVAIPISLPDNITRYRYSFNFQLEFSPSVFGP